MRTTKTTTSTEGRDLILTRIIDAPRAKVFKAWTDPALLTQWFAPLPWTTPKAETDVRVGGSNLFVMRGPDGKDVPLRGVYLDVVNNAPRVHGCLYRGMGAVGETVYDRDLDVRGHGRENEIHGTRRTLEYRRPRSTRKNGLSQRLGTVR